MSITVAELEKEINACGWGLMEHKAKLYGKDGRRIYLDGLSSGVDDSGIGPALVLPGLKSVKISKNTDKVHKRINTTSFALELFCSLPEAARKLYANYRFVERDMGIRTLCYDPLSKSYSTSTGANKESVVDAMPDELFILMAGFFDGNIKISYIAHRKTNAGIWYDLDMLTNTCTINIMNTTLNDQYTPLVIFSKVQEHTTDAVHVDILRYPVGSENSISYLGGKQPSRQYSCLSLYRDPATQIWGAGDTTKEPEFMKKIQNKHTYLVNPDNDDMNHGDGSLLGNVLYSGPYIFMYEDYDWKKGLYVNMSGIWIPVDMEWMSTMGINKLPEEIVQEWQICSLLME